MYKNFINWAENEIKLACKKEQEETRVVPIHYKIAEILYKDCLVNHTDVHKVTKNALNVFQRLIEDKPLTPLEDTLDSWIPIKLSIVKNAYKHKRYQSLFKIVDNIGMVTYEDSTRAVEVAKDEEGRPIIIDSGVARHVIDDLFPITMPYYPTDDRYYVWHEKRKGNGNVYNIARVFTPQGKTIYACEGDNEKYMMIDKEHYIHLKELTEEI